MGIYISRGNVRRAAAMVGLEYVESGDMYSAGKDIWALPNGNTLTTYWQDNGLANGWAVVSRKVGSRTYTKTLRGIRAFELAEKLFRIDENTELFAIETHENFVAKQYSE